MFRFYPAYFWAGLGLATPLVVSAQGSTQKTADVSSRPSRQLQPPEHTSTLLGTVVDSIHLGPLVGATVLLDGTSISAITDDHGKFRMDSIPPRTYRIAVFHPLLDTLGFSIGTEPMRMGPDSVRQIVLSTPSAKEVIENSCPLPKRRLGPGAIIGHVLDPDTHAPLDSVRVSLAWMDYDVGKDVGVKRSSKLRQGISDASGSFVICGIPAGVKGTIRADRGEAQTAEVPVALDESPLLLQSLTLSLAVGTDSAPLVGKALLSGRVVDPRGLPVPDARVSVQGTKIATSSAKDGTFHLEGLPSGTREVLVRRVGFSPIQLAVPLSAATPSTVVVRMDKATPTLAAVHVEASMDSALKKDGFTDRRRMGMGYYLTPEDIDRQHPQQLSSLFQMIPGFRISPGVGTGMAIRSVRDGCITYWVDGVQWRENQPGDMDYQFRPEQLMAIETYSSSGAPVQFQAPGQSSCSVVLIWTNRTIPQNNRR